MEKINLTAAKRTVMGRKVKGLRAGGLIPANVYTRNEPSLALEIKEGDLRSIYQKAGETSLVELKIENETKHVLITGISTSPLTGEILHADFREVSLKEKIHAAIPVEFIGESSAEKSGLGTAVLQVSEIEVEALPTKLPEKFEIDASTLVDLESKILVSDLKVDADVKILLEQDAVVASVVPPQKEEEVSAPIVTEITEQKAETETAETEGQSEENKDSSN